jgi:hypothetical protein
MKSLKEEIQENPKLQGFHGFSTTGFTQESYQNLISFPLQDQHIFSGIKEAIAKEIIEEFHIQPSGIELFNKGIGRP